MPIDRIDDRRARLRLRLKLAFTTPVRYPWRKYLLSLESRVASHGGEIYIKY
jgi:hypothetical protein